MTPAPTIGFIGLGKMGLPLARCALRDGYTVHGTDFSPAARAAFAQLGGIVQDTVGAVGAAADIVITVLPTGRIVRAALLGDNGLPAATDRLVIDMSSSAPGDTLGLEAPLQTLGWGLVDAPVSGGVARAVEGTLAIMLGGPAHLADRAEPVLATMGSSILRTGPVGSGHTMKALNNFVSATGLAASLEAVLIGRKFGLQPHVIVDVLNASSGRNNATERKLKQFVLSETFGSGFDLALMAKDIGIAEDLARDSGAAMPTLTLMRDLWDQANRALGAGADHTEFYRFLNARLEG